MADEQLFLPVDEAYDRWSRSYDRCENPMVYMANEVIERRLPALAGLRVFEFGCGTGRNLEALGRNGAAGVAGCDLSAGMLEQARRRAPAAQLLRHDMNQPLPLESGSVDLALFCLSLEHVADIRLPLAEARRIVRPGGQIWIIEMHPYRGLGGLGAHFEDGAAEIRMPSFAHQFETYLNAFVELGLLSNQCREWKPADVGNPEPLRSAKRGPEMPLAVEFRLSR